jgi:hypothetical protein
MMFTSHNYTKQKETLPVMMFEPHRRGAFATVRQKLTFFSCPRTQLDFRA